MELSILILTAFIQGSGRKRSLWNGKAYGLCRRCLGRGEVRR